MRERHSPPSRRSRTRAVRRTVADERVHAQRTPTPRRTVSATPVVESRALPRWLLVVCAIAAGIAALVLVFSEPLRSPAVPMLRLGVPLLCALAAGLIFVPLQRSLNAPGLGWQGMIGWTLLGYILAFVPAPSGSLLDLPELPSYLLLFFAVFYAVASAAVPLMWLIARRRIADPSVQIQRARRQAYELATLVVLVLVMAGLRVLTPWAFGLLALVMILGEALLMFQLENTSEG